MNALRGIVAAIEWAARALVVALMVAMLAIVISQFVDRYVTPVWKGYPADEYVKVALIWLTFIGFGLAMRAGVAIRVDLVDHALPANVRRWLSVAFDLVLAAMLGVIIHKAVRLYEISSMQIILGTDMTVAVPVLGMTIGCLLMLLAVVSRLLRNLFRIEL